MSAVELLQAARDLLAANELCQRRYSEPCNDDTGKMGFCAMGALIHVEFKGMGFSWARAALRDALPIDDWGYQSVPNWNDQPGRTKAEVLALYDRAIESVRRNV